MYLKAEPGTLRLSLERLCDAIMPKSQNGSDGFQRKRQTLRIEAAFGPNQTFGL
jgi:hypothetical protein